MEGKGSRLYRFGRRMIFDRGGGKLAKNLPNGLKVSLELFHVGVFSRVDRVERVEVGKLNHETRN